MNLIELKDISKNYKMDKVIVKAVDKASFSIKKGEFAAISDDGGKTWDTANEICLRPCHNNDLGYPSSCVLPSGEILTVYYQPENVGEKPCLMATKWRVTK